MEQKGRKTVRKEKPAGEPHNMARQYSEAAGASAGRRLTPAAERKILHARAQALAREPRREDAAAECLEIMEFLLADETYGIEMRYVRESLPLKDFTPVPCTPSFVLGLISVRSQIVSVVDMRKFFDLPDKGLTDLNKVIVLHDEGMEFGILADVVIGVRRIPFSGLQPTLPTLTGIREEYLKGVTNERLVLLDGGKLLNDKRLVVHEGIED